MQTSLKAALLACTVLASAALAAPASAQSTSATPAMTAPAAPAQPDAMVAPAAVEKLSGIVTDIFGDRFVLDTGTAHVLVSSRLPLAAGQSLKTGDRLTIEGNTGPDGFDAASIMNASGTELLASADDLPSGPLAPPPIGGPAPVPGPAAAQPGQAVPDATPPAPPAGPVVGALPPGPDGAVPPAPPVGPAGAVPPPPPGGPLGAVPPPPVGPADPVPPAGPVGLMPPAPPGGPGEVVPPAPAGGPAAPPPAMANAAGPSPARAITEADASSKLEAMGFGNLKLQRRGPADFQFQGTFDGKDNVSVALGPDQSVTGIRASGSDRIPLSAIEKLLPDGVANALSARGVDTVSSYQATPRAYIVSGYAKDGSKVAIEMGALRRVTTVSVDDPMPAPSAEISASQADGAAAAQGYKLDSGGLSSKDGKFVGTAFNPYGEHVRITLDRDGVVSKEQLL